MFLMAYGRKQLNDVEEQNWSFVIGKFLISKFDTDLALRPAFFELPPSDI